ncbi:MAG: C39 family peptidase [Thermomicrobiales bacterium]
MRRTLLAVVMVVSVLGMGGFMAPKATLAATQSVDSWIELSTGNPAPGCPIDVSVEVRSQGAPVTGVAVELALHQDGNLLTAVHGVTNDAGIDFLTLDTSALSSGVGYWLDINVGGVYLTGQSIVTGSTDCGAPKSIKTSGTISVVPGASGSTSAEVSGMTGTGAGSKVFVPTYQQQRGLSCEFASMYIATSAFGDGVSEYAFDDVVGLSPNPHLGYRGNITGTWGNTTDYGVYAQPLSWALAQFGFVGDAFYGVGDDSTITSRLDNGWPVVVWLALWGDQSFRTEYDGQSFTLVPGMHVMVAYGYDSDGIYLSDPGSGTYRFYDWATFNAMWSVLDGMAMAVHPA